MPRRRPALAPLRAAVAALALAGAGAAGAQRADAPLGVGAAGPVRALALDMPLADARGAASPTVEVRWVAANTWSAPTTLLRGGERAEVRLDAQTDVLQATLEFPWRRARALPLADRITTRLEARVLRTWGGWTDRSIEAWHGAVRSWNFDREAWPRDALDVRVGAAGGGRAIAVRSPRSALGDVAVRTSVRIAGARSSPAPGDAPARLAVALRLDLKIPTGSPWRLGGSGAPDAGVGVEATCAPARWLTGHGLASLRAVGPLPRGVRLRTRPLQPGLELSLVARLSRHLALLLEDRLLSPALADHGWRLSPEVDRPQASAWYALFRAQNQISAGLRVGEATVFLSEDFTLGRRHARDDGPGWFYDSNAPDLAFGLAWAHAL